MKKINPSIFNFLILGFIFLNLLAVVHSNRPEWFAIENAFPPVSKTYFQIRNLHWRLATYAHIVGLDNRWEMFSYMYKDDWKIVYKAKFKEDRNSVVLPLPLQSERSFLDEWFFDFRDAKYRLNTYNNKLARVSYENFLCRQFRRFQGKTIEAIICDLETREIFPRAKALELKTHLSDELKIIRFDYTVCP